MMPIMATREDSAMAKDVLRAAQTAQDAVKKAKEAYHETVALKEAYQEQAMMLAEMCHASGGMVWKKDCAGRFVFASQMLCEEFFWSNCADVVGRTDRELIADFNVRFPGKAHTYGELCISTDAFTLQKGERCRFVEMGMIGDQPFILHVIKTPANDGGTIGFSFNCSSECEDVNRRVHRMLNEGRAEKLQDGVYWIHDPHPQTCNYIADGYPGVE